MQSTIHTALVDLLRNHPALVPSLLRHALGVDVPDHASVRVGDAVLDQLATTEYRADLVLELGDETRIALAVIVEVQLRVDDDKPFVWPAYATTYRARRRCEVCLLVVTPDAKVAAWARRPIRLGPDNPSYRTLVLGPDEVPLVTDPALAVVNPSLAVLSLLARGPECGLQVLLAVLRNIRAVDKCDHRVYVQLIHKAIGAAMQSALKEHFQMLREQSPDTEYPDFLQDVFLEGEARGKAEGKAEGEARSVLRLLERRGVALSPEQRARIETCRDLAQLDVWFDRACTVASADALFV